MFQFLHLLNTINQYIESILPELGLGKRFFESKNNHLKRVDDANVKLQAAFNNVAQSYHKLAVQNFTIVAEGQFIDTHGKKTKKINYATLLKISKLIKFKP